MPRSPKKSSRKNSKKSIHGYNVPARYAFDGKDDGAKFWNKDLKRYYIKTMLAARPGADFFRAGEKIFKVKQMPMVVFDCNGNAFNRPVRKTVD